MKLENLGIDGPFALSFENVMVRTVPSASSISYRRISLLSGSTLSLRVDTDASRG
jgi:hypothetical protein